MLRPKFDLQQNPTHFCLNVNSLIYDVIFDIYHFLYIYIYLYVYVNKQVYIYIDT